ncbi:MAG: FAD-dependent oxidoreductase [Oscillospiraceae bacterium]|nr:FAD-dependent oxidoreductase [Oscillospiraceae bacterium]
MSKQPCEQLYPHLFTPLRVGGNVFKNRVFTAPTHLPISIDNHGFFSREGMTYYGNFAKGGSAAIHMGEVIMDRRNSLAHEDHMNLVDESTLQTLNTFNEYAHIFGAKTSVELNHSGQFAMPQFGDGSDPMGPVEMNMPAGTHVRAMNEEDMAYVANIYAKAANMAKRGGCDMVCMHYGHGWLMGAFLSPLVNTRTDRYGGSLENRMRFPRQVLEAVRQAVGPDFLIEVRLSGDEYTKGGIVIEDTIEYVKMIEDLADLVHFSAGNRLFPETRAIMHPSHFLEEGHNVHLAAAAKKAGIKIPVGAIGSIQNPDYAEKVLAEGMADYVLMARGWVADPDWGNKARAGKAEDIRPCIKCFRCMDLAGGKRTVSRHNIADYLTEFPTVTRRTECSVNPLHGNAMCKIGFPQPKAKKRVAVVGGGPAGMVAALTAAERGHEVILFEKTGTLGGQLHYAKHVWFKTDMEQYRQYLIRQVNKAPVDVRLNCEATPELLKTLMPGAVIVAVGAEPLIPRIPGVEGENVVPAISCYGREDQLGNSVVLVGGGMVGCETALHLSSKGRKVTLVEMLDVLAPDGIYTERLHTMEYLQKDPNITVLTDTRCVEIHPKGALVAGEGEKTWLIEADSIVLSAGMKSLTAQSEVFNGLAFDVIPVGDCAKVGTISSATAAAYNAALIIGLDG